MSAHKPTSLVPSSDPPPGVLAEQVPMPTSIQDIHLQMATAFAGMVNANEGLDEGSDLAASTFRLSGDSQWAGKHLLVATAVLEGLEEIHIHTLLHFIEQALRDEAEVTDDGST
ncbi:MAG: hypothetical protein F4Y95_07335 [Chloroflexi bacterium]|nr:hypothetical protein [Chloroflexota bacterium]